MPTNEQRRETAKRKLERQLERRAEKARKQRIMTIAASVVAVLADFAIARARTVKMLSQARATDLARPADFEGYGPTTLRGLVHLLCSHDQQHLAGLHWLLGRMAAQRDFDINE